MADEKRTTIDKIEEIIENASGGSAFTHDWSGGLRRFSNLTWDDTKKVILTAGELADLSPWNSFVGTLELIKEAGRLEGKGLICTFHGYLVGQGREDARFTLEGLSAYSDDDRALAYASGRGAELGADEFGVVGGDCVVWWWD